MPARKDYPIPAQPTQVGERLHQALGLHQARRFAEAEALYRQVLIFRPDLADVHVNCALTQIGQGKHAEAEASLRRAIAARPDLAAAHFRMGDVLCFQNRFQEAIAFYRKALSLKRDYAEAYNNCGNALLHLGDMDQAEAAYRKAIALKPEYAPAHNNLAHILLRGGHLEEALALLTRAVTLAPDYADAQNNLGTTLHMLNRSDEAHAAFRSAVRLAPENADAYINLSNCLFDTGKMRDAEAAATEGVRLDPGMSRGHIAHGNALRAQGNLKRAEACYRAALTCEPDSSDARKHLAETLCEAGRLSEGFSVYIQHAQLIYGTGAPPSAGSMAAHKQRHDVEQRAWLGDPVTDFHLADGNRIAGPAVNAAGQITQVKQTGRVPQPRIAIIDDLLTTEALEKLRRFCMDSTIWHRIYDDGYLGAFPEHGFAPPLLAQIAEELRSVHPAVIGDHPLLQFWAFKYDSKLRGTRTHADFAAVNVNFWITPDQANLDPGHGGMVLWDVGAPLDWDFAKYNAAEDDIRAFLKLHKAEPIVVPYLANRAVVFDSDLFHETDTIHFKPGYENRRINITLLFGHRRARCP